MISVVIPLYNKEHQIAKTLRTVLDQSFQDFEIVIVNDGSNDDSVSEVQKFTDPRIRLINQSNAGVSAARNLGIKEARGEYIALLDADDRWDKDYLQTQLDLIAKYVDCAVFGTNYRFEDHRGKHYETVINKLPFEDESDGILTNYFDIASSSHVPIWTSAVVIRRDAILEINGFPIGIKSGEDLLTWAKLALKYNIAYTKNPHATYHLDEGYEYGKEPVRRQDIGDPVGKELILLLRENPKVSGLRKYISHWHKMRASVAIQFGEKSETIKECFLALKYNPLNIKIIPIITLTIIPSSIRKQIISLKRR